MKAEEVFRDEIATYLRELPRLVEEGHAGRHAVIKGNEIVSIWDTQRDAMQASREKFGLELAPVVKIGAVLGGKLALMIAQAQQKEQECPS